MTDLHTFTIFAGASPFRDAKAAATAFGCGGGGQRQLHTLRPRAGHAAKARPAISIPPVLDGGRAALQPDTEVHDDPAGGAGHED